MSSLIFHYFLYVVPVKLCQNSEARSAVGKGSCTTHGRAAGKSFGKKESWLTCKVAEVIGVLGEYSVKDVST
jgi:hypothetical protein